MIKNILITFLTIVLLVSAKVFSIPVLLGINLLIMVFHLKKKWFNYLMALNLIMFTGLSMIYDDFYGASLYLLAYLLYVYKDKLMDYMDENHYLKNQLLLNSESDSLSGLYTNQYVYDYLTERLTHISDQDLAILLMDIDNFRRINDKHGHKYGDEVIKQIANLLKDIVKSSDVVGRYGGEEFVIILNQGDLVRAFKIADQIRSRLDALPLKDDDKLTMSIGIAFYNKDTADSLLDKANEQLRQAKKLGRRKEKE